MSRFLVSVAGGLIIAVITGGLIGAIAAELLSKSPGGQREGGGAMAGLFLVGTVAGFIGLLAGGWLLWRLAADPSRHALIWVSLFAALTVFAIAAFIALQPTHYEPDPAPPGKRVEAQLELRIAANRLPPATPPGALQFDLRCGGRTLTVDWDPAAVRSEGGAATIPVTFRMTNTQTVWLFAAMLNGTQLGTFSLDLVSGPEETSPWTEWAQMEGGLEIRYRTAVLDK